MRRRDRKRGQVFARCWSQDVLGTREDTERVTEETQGQFPVLPTKSESKLNDIFSMQIFLPFASDVLVLEDPLLNVLFTVHCL